LAVGRLVIADLTGVTACDRETAEVLIDVARSTARWHVDFCVVAPLSGALALYLRGRDPGCVLALYGSSFEAVAGFEVAA
jgi:hypothetical protein